MASLLVTFAAKEESRAFQKLIRRHSDLQVLLTGIGHKLALIEAGHTILVVLMRRDVNMGLANVEIKTALDAVAKSSRMA